MSKAASMQAVANVRLKPWHNIPVSSARRVAALKKVRTPDNHFMRCVPGRQCAGFPENSGTRPGKILEKTLALK